MCIITFTTGAVKMAIVRYEKNPFLEQTTITTKKSRITIGTSDDVIVNTSTGDISATNVVAVKEVDDAMFIKLFTQNIGLMTGLQAQGVKALSFLMWAVQNYAMRKDVVQLDDMTREDFLTNNNIAFSRRTMYQGLSQLEKAQIIAKARKAGFYFINPNFLFNGDRVRFVTEIRRKSKNKQAQLEEQGQTRLIE